MRIPEKNIPAPWRRFYGPVPAELDYPEGSMFRAIEPSAASEPERTALSYMNRDYSYSTLMRRIDEAARSFAALGVTRGERVLLCLPNTPQAVYCLYALNRIGAVACLIHPLSAEGELRHALGTVKSRVAVTFDGAYGKFLGVAPGSTLERIVFTTPADELPRVKLAAYTLASGRKYPRPEGGMTLKWRDFLALGDGVSLSPDVGRAEDEAVVLFSGGTSGEAKGVRLSNLAMNALAVQTAAMLGKPIERWMSMLAAMPMFHGFGLGVCVHTLLTAGGKTLLVPRLVLKEYAALIKKKKPTFIAGVPTLYEAMIRNPFLDGVKLDFLEGVFSGGDSLSPELKKRFDGYLAEHGAHVRVREGYGLTECVTASCLTPIDREVEGSIGIPFPDTFYEIRNPKSGERMAPGEEGEICITGPSLMSGYIDREEETALALRRHEDGEVWLHTGDLGMMDADGFVFFRQRLKRVIVTSGYNVYPSRIESVLEKHPAVERCCVIGVPDPYRMQKVKAFIVPKKGAEPSDALKEDILGYCRKEVARYALPREIEFRSELPLTGVGKVAYSLLEKEEQEKYGRNKA